MITQSKAKILAAEEKYKERDYWLKKLSGQLVKAAFPYDYQTRRPDTDTPGKNTVKYRLPQTVASKLKQLSQASDPTLHIILTAGVVVLLAKYTGLNDIIVGTPIYKQEIEGEFINTVLPIRSRLEKPMTFKHLLLQMKDTVLAAVENQNYPIETLLYNLNMKWSENDFPLFDVAVLFENIHDIRYIDFINPGMLFLFQRNGEYIEGVVRYHPQHYEKRTIDNIALHLERLLQEVAGDINSIIAGINILSGEEKKQLLVDFNNNRADFPIQKTICHWIKKHARQIPDKIAVIDGEKNAEPGHRFTTSITYRELNNRADRMTPFLKTRGVKREDRVGIIINRSTFMIESILAVWKAGGVYIPVEPGWPQERIKYIIEDCRAAVVLTESPQEAGEKYPVSTDNQGPNREEQTNGAAYIIYTSGSTGTPKGVVIEHRGMMNHIYAKINDLEITGESIVAQNASHTFDISVWQFFSALTAGGKTVIYDHPLVIYADRFITWLIRDRVTILEVVPSYLAVMMDILETAVETFPSLRYLLVTGETITPALLKRWFEKYTGITVMNAYGPTEASDDITHYRMDRIPHGERVPIGKPVHNLVIYILDDHMNLCPRGVKGEICVSGTGIGRGYLNNPELTAEKFCLRPPGGTLFQGTNKSYRQSCGHTAMQYHSPTHRHTITPLPRHPVYLTGDIGCWRRDGTIDFYGRKDHQVKIRGFRIELGEIETRLMNHEEIKEAVVVDRRDDAGNTYLCAYIIVNPGQDTTFDSKPSWTAELDEYLRERLPDYMVPAYFVPLEKMPLTNNGKINRYALPDPQFNPVGEIIAPRNNTEKKLAGIWSEVLGIEKEDVSINANFFESGGHSLKATIFVSRIHKELNVKLPLAELFKTPTIKEIASYIREKAPEDRCISIEPVEKREYYVLSSAQKRIYISQQLDTNSIVFNMSQAIPVRIEADSDIEQVEQTFIRLINRHESLKTSFHLINHQLVQKVHQPGDFEFAIRRLPGYDTLPPGKIAKDIITPFITPFDLAQPPLLRAGLMRISNQESLLIVDIHHIAADGFSHDIMRADFQALYQGPQLTTLRLQYKDFSQWQNSPQQKKTVNQEKAYWLNRLQGEIPVLELPTGHKRPIEKSPGGESIYLTLDSRLTDRLKQLALESETTRYIILLAAFTVLLAKYTGQDDIVVGSTVNGRRHADLQNIIGMFVNMLAMRNNVRGDHTFWRFLKEVRKNVLHAFDNQEYQFDDLVIALGLEREHGRNPLFDVVLDYFTIEVQEEEHVSVEKPGIPAGIQKEMGMDPIWFKPGKSIFDLVLGIHDTGHRIDFRITYLTCLYNKETIETLGRHLIRILENVTRDPRVKIYDIEMLDKEEKDRILVSIRDQKGQLLGVDHQEADHMDAAFNF